MALYAGAFDERIALTIPHESGGGGTISWRCSDMLEKREKVEVENLLHAQGGNVNFPWYALRFAPVQQRTGQVAFRSSRIDRHDPPRAVLMIESSNVPRIGELDLPPNST